MPKRPPPREEMKVPRRLILPMVDARGGAGVAPDPARITQGWEHRFVATEERMKEMVALYRELGFEVLTEPAGGAGLDAQCQACFSGQLRYHAIYTRRPSAPSGSPDAGE